MLVVKIGGSLLDQPNLIPVFQRWRQNQPERTMLLIVGGGDFAEAFRKYSRVFSIPEERAHWLATESLVLSYRLMQFLLPGYSSWNLPDVEAKPGNYLLNAWDFLCRDETSDDSLPKTWDVTTDSIAAQVAMRMQARRLCIWKSCPAPDTDVQTLADRGFIDPHFPKLVPTLTQLNCQLEFINWQTEARL